MLKALYLSFNFSSLFPFFSFYFSSHFLCLLFDFYSYASWIIFILYNRFNTQSLPILIFQIMHGFISLPALLLISNYSSDALQLFFCFLVNIFSFFKKISSIYLLSRLFLVNKQSFYMY